MSLGKWIRSALLLAAAGMAVHAGARSPTGDRTGAPAGAQQATTSVAEPARPNADSAAGADLALLFGGLGAIGFVTLRRGRSDT